MSPKATELRSLAHTRYSWPGVQGRLGLMQQPKAKT